MIIYGSRMYGKKNQVRSHGTCPHCRKVAPQESYDARKWGHLYFIPIVPMGGHVRVVRECSSCHMGSHIERDKLPDIVASLQKLLDQAVVAVGANEAEMDVGGHRAPVATVINANLSDAYCLIGEKEVRQLLDNLRAVNAGEELALAEARVAEISGRTKEADARFADLARGGQLSVTLYQAARYMRDRGRIPEATAIAERLETGLPTDLDLKQLLIDCYTAAADWTKLATTYESCFLIAPAIKADKAILKTYQKACKKAGRPPQP